MLYRASNRKALSTVSTGGRSGQGGRWWTREGQMLGGAGHLSLEGGEVGGDAGDVEVDDGLLAFGAEEEGAVGVGVHEEVFGQDGRGRGMA